MSAVTPLRQVMSKSIQKAFAEHGLPAASTAVRGASAAFQRKNMFDTTTSPSLDGDSGGAKKHLMPGSPALDLRLSPAVRRSQSESDDSLQLQNCDEQQRQYKDLPKIKRNIMMSAQKLTTESIVITRTEHLSSVSSSTSAVSSLGSINTIKPHTSTNSSYQSSASNSAGGSVFKSCSSSVEIITATTEQIQQVQAVQSVASVASHQLPPITPITRIPGAVIHKKLIKFETPKVESCDSRESQNSPSDVFFTPNSTPLHSKSSDHDGNESSVEMRKRKLLVKQNLNGRFSKLRKPSLKECAHSTAFSRIDNLTMDSVGSPEDVEDYEDEVFATDENDVPVAKPEEIKKSNQANSTGGLWSIMSSVMGISTRKASFAKSSSKNESSVLIDANSNSIVKRCASIAGN